jgi:hypothetical protein
MMKSIAVGDLVWFNNPNEFWTKFSHDVGVLKWARVASITRDKNDVWVEMTWDGQQGVSLHYAPASDLKTKEKQ